MVKELRGLSGWGWDEDTHMVTAPDGVWEAYIEVCIKFSMLPSASHAQ